MFQAKTTLSRGLGIFVMAALVGLIAWGPRAAAAENNRVEQVKKEMAEAAQDVKDFTIEQKDEAVRKGEAGLAALDRETEALQERIKRNWDKMDKTARDKADKALKALKKQRKAAAKKLEELKKSSSKSWDHAKEGFVKSYQDLREAFDKAVKEF